jgi:hypothetical protein
VNSDWYQCDNWDVGYPPSSRDTVLISSSSAVSDPIIMQEAEAKNVVINSKCLVLEGDARLTIETSGSGY